MSRYSFSTQARPVPSPAPAAVPTSPMISPCSMKMVITARLDAPMVFRIAMSRLFSITSRTSDAMMLRAATMTIRPIVIEMAIFSSQRAEYSDLFMSAQSCTQ